MKRDDTTTPEQQRAFQGKHISGGSGLWSYPHVQRDGKVKPGNDYLRCVCGWRVIEVARLQRSKRKASRLLHEHIEEMKS